MLVSRRVQKALKYIEVLSPAGSCYAASSSREKIRAMEEREEAGFREAARSILCYRRPISGTLLDNFVSALDHMYWYIWCFEEATRLKDGEASESRMTQICSRLLLSADELADNLYGLMQSRGLDAVKDCFLSVFAACESEQDAADLPGGVASALSGSEQGHGGIFAHRNGCKRIMSADSRLTFSH